MGKIIGIDLGTTNSALAYAEIRPDEASLEVSVPAGGKTWADSAYVTLASVTDLIASRSGISRFSVSHSSRSTPDA